MNTDKAERREPFMGLHAELTQVVLQAFYEVYNELGGGFLESVYHMAMQVALAQAGLRVESEVPVAVWFRGGVVGKFIADMVVEGKVLLEFKAVSVLDRSHEMQVLHYLRATTLEVALLINFGPRPQFKRFLLDNEEKKIRIHPCESVVGSSGGAAR